ncbi:MAG TPA: DUF5131 family protein, partial [Geminicoccaceae bacterium]|nr:DUF5131 family protein [Geminicoccaceae bacterium]
LGWAECYTTDGGRGRLNALTGWAYNESLINGRWEDNLDPADEGRHGNAPRDPQAVDWVVVGGESGSGARPFDIAWARSLRDQCKAAGVPFFLKQLGRFPLSHQDEGYPWSPLFENEGHGDPTGEWGFDGSSSKGGDPAEWPEDLRVREYPPI